MMKVIIILALATVAIAASVPQPEEEVSSRRQGKKQDEVQIEVNEIHRHLDGTYEIDVELSNGQIWIENAVLKTVLDEEGNEKTILSISGVSEYKNADGSVDHREYKGDENGAEIKGNSVPHLENEVEESDAPAGKSIGAKPAPSKGVAVKPKPAPRAKAAPKPKPAPAKPQPAVEPEEESEDENDDEE